MYAIVLLLAALPFDQRGPAIVVSGTGEVEVAPDEAVVTAGVLTEARSAAEAVQENNEKMERVLDALKKREVPAQHIRTTGFTVSPRYDYRPDGRAPQLIGYSASNLVQLKIDRLEQLGPLLDELIGAGANRIHGISFSARDPTARLDEARRKAMADARRKAELLAEAAGATLGRPIRIEEQTVSPPRTFVAQLRGEQAAVPIAPGQQTLTAEVSVTFSLEKTQPREKRGGKTASQ